MQKSLAICIYINTAIAVALSLYFFVIPAGELVRDLRDPGLRGEEVPRFAFRWHRALSPKYEAWVRDRVRSGEAERLSVMNIAGTEWPLFGSVFYLWATEALQEAAQENPDLCPVPPNQYARGAIEAAAALVADPGHAGWVRQHWGEDYLEQENLFYRMLLLSALTSYQKLLGDTRYEELLRWQVESLARELDESPQGLRGRWVTWIMRTSWRHRLWSQVGRCRTEHCSCRVCSQRFRMPHTWARPPRCLP